MPVRQLRRLGPVISDSLHDQIDTHPLNGLSWRPRVDALEREHPELIIRDGTNILAAEGHAGVKLLYGFEGEAAFVDRFPSMFEKLLPRIRRVLRSESVRLRLTYMPARPLIEPVLKQQWFAPSRDWMEFSLARTAKLPAASVPSGVRLRDGGAADTPELIKIDRQAFPDTPVPTEAMWQRLYEDESVMIAMAGKEMAGFCIYSQPEEGIGWINTLAVADSHQGRGIGAALTVRTTKRLFADGARSVALTTNDDNRNAIRLYVRLGFKQTRAGRDYARPTDPRVIAAIKAEKQGTLIRFGGWR